MSDLQKLANVLAGMRESLPEGSKGTAAHLFGIKYARALESLSLDTLAEIATRAGLDSSIKAEIRKGVKLAPYVAIRGR